MEVLTQAPQPTIKCYHSISHGKAVKSLYMEFTPTSFYYSGKNLLSYNFENSVDNFGGGFSFTVKEDIKTISDISIAQEFKQNFMDAVQPLDIIVISESGTEKIDYIGVVTKISIGGIASNLNKSVTVSGKSIEWLFQFYNINTDIKACIFQNTEANNAFKLDLAAQSGQSPISIKDIANASFKMFKQRTSENAEVSNTVIGDIIDIWYGKDFIVASMDKFAYPISSNMFDSGKIDVISFIRKLLPQPLYEIFGFIDDMNKPKICIRKAPYDNPYATFTVEPVQLTDFTLTRSCEEVYTAFMPYIEGSSMSSDFYMNLQAAESGTKEKGYNSAKANPEKVSIYGYQLLTCSFVGYAPDAKTNKETLNNEKIKELADQLEKWFSKLDEMYAGDLTIVNITKDRCSKIGEWLSFAGGQFYVNQARHTWNYGDNPMINFQVSRGGNYYNKTRTFTRLENLSAVYGEFVK